MKYKVEDTIPTCQYGNRHITVECDSHSEVLIAINQLNILYMQNLNFVSKEQKKEIEQEKKPFKPIPKWNYKTKQYEEVK